MNEKNLGEQQPEIPLPTGELVDAGGSVLTATARHGMPGFWSCELLRVVLLRNVGEKNQFLDERGFVVKAETLSILFKEHSGWSPWQDLRWAITIVTVKWEERMTEASADSRTQSTSTTLLEFIGDSVRATSYQVDLQVHESMLPLFF